MARDCMLFQIKHCCFVYYTQMTVFRFCLNSRASRSCETDFLFLRSKSWINSFQLASVLLHVTKNSMLQEILIRSKLTLRQQYSLERKRNLYINLYDKVILISTNLNNAKQTIRDKPLLIIRKMISLLQWLIIWIFRKMKFLDSCCFIVLH